MNNIKNSDALVSIIIPTRNAGAIFDDVLKQVFAQKYKHFEVIIIDSASHDTTLAIAKKYPTRIFSIKPSEFGHGRTRNYGVSLAKGKYIVFLTQDSQPQNPLWLSHLISGFTDEDIAGVYGQQIPRANEKILDAYFFKSLYTATPKVWTQVHAKQGDNVFSDANSALRKELMMQYPYKDGIIVSEDYEWAFRMFKKGYKIVYKPEASVIHSHSYTLQNLFKRNFDVGVSYKDIYSSRTSVSSDFLQKGLSIYLHEITYLARSRYFYLIPLATLRDFIRFAAISLGKNEQIFPVWMKKKYFSAQTWYWK